MYFASFVRLRINRVWEFFNLKTFSNKACDGRDKGIDKLWQEEKYTLDINITIEEERNYNKIPVNTLQHLSYKAHFQ